MKKPFVPPTLVLVVAILAAVSAASAQTPAADQMATSTLVNSTASTKEKPLREQLSQRLGIPLEVFPANVHIVPAGAGAPAQLAEMPRITEGKWDHVLPALLVVERIGDDGKLQVVYCQGGRAPNPAWCKRFPVNFEGGELRSQNWMGILFSWRVVGRQLVGVLYGRYGNYPGTFTEVLLPSQ